MNKPFDFFYKRSVSLRSMYFRYSDPELTSIEINELYKKNTFKTRISISGFGSPKSKCLIINILNYSINRNELNVMITQPKS